MAIEDLIKNSEAVIECIDPTEAKKLINKINDFIISQNIKDSNPDLHSKLKSVIFKLQIVAFPNLSDEECEEILRRSFLKSFEIEIPMDNQLTAKLFSIPYIPRDDLRKKLQRAILENDEKLGPLTFGQWLREFEKMFSARTRDQSAPVRFVMEHPQARLLNEDDKKKLKEAVHIYDYFLVATLPATGPILNEILAAMPVAGEAPAPRPVVAPAPYQKFGASRYGAQESESAQTYRTAPASAPGQKINLPLSQALQKYPNLGEKLISGNPIKIKFLPAPARPSIKNWIADYHQTLGAGRHEMMDRGNYLYHSENASRLTPGERQKLAAVLKALDENEPISVDVDRQEIVFPHPETLSQEERRTLEKPPLPPGEDARRAGEGAGYRFSSPQRLPAEKEDSHYRPYRISPISYGEPKKDNQNGDGKPEPKVEGNVVDLRNN